ncbi:hypothetical protein WA158_004997 [Blastocystis sp. Blastoise]
MKCFIQVFDKHYDVDYEESHSYEQFIQAIQDILKIDKKYFKVLSSDGMPCQTDQDIQNNSDLSFIVVIGIYICSYDGTSRFIPIHELDTFLSLEQQYLIEFNHFCAFKSNGQEIDMSTNIYQYIQKNQASIYVQKIASIPLSVIHLITHEEIHVCVPQNNAYSSLIESVQHVIDSQYIPIFLYNNQYLSPLSSFIPDAYSRLYYICYYFCYLYDYLYIYILYCIDCNSLIHIDLRDSISTNCNDIYIQWKWSPTYSILSEILVNSYNQLYKDIYRIEIRDDITTLCTFIQPSIITGNIILYKLYIPRDHLTKAEDYDLYLKLYSFIINNELVYLSHQFSHLYQKHNNSYILTPENRMIEYTMDTSDRNSFLSLYSSIYEHTYISLEELNLSSIYILYIYTILSISILDLSLSPSLFHYIYNAIIDNQLLNLVTINLSNNQLSDEGALLIEDIISRGYLKNLETIKYYNNSISFPAIKQLNIAIYKRIFNQEPEEDKDFNFIKDSHGNQSNPHPILIECLETWCNYMDPSKDLLSLMSSRLIYPALYSLETISIENEDIGVNGAIYLYKCISTGILPFLSNLTLNNVNLGDNGYIYIHKLISMNCLTHLSTLELNKNELTDRSVDLLIEQIQLGCLPHLCTLTLYVFHLHETEAIKYINHFESIPANIQNLTISNKEVTSKDIPSILMVIRYIYKSLIILDLSCITQLMTKGRVNNNITDKGISVFMNSYSRGNYNVLDSFTIYGNMLTENKEHELKILFQGTQIHYLSTSDMYLEQYPEATDFIHYIYDTINIYTNSIIDLKGHLYNEYIPMFTHFITTEILDNITVLDISNNRLTADNLKIFIEAINMGKMKNLKTIYFFQNYIGFEGLYLLRRLLRKSVKILLLEEYFVDLSPEEKSVLTNIYVHVDPRKKENIVLPFKSIKSDGFNSILNCVQDQLFLPLKRLILNGNNIYLEGLKLLASFISNSHLVCLEELNIAGNNFGPEGAMYIYSILSSLSLPLLRIFDISRNNLCNDGIEAVEKALTERGSSKLEEIHIFFNNMSKDKAISLYETAQSISPSPQIYSSETWDKYLPKETSSFLAGRLPLFNDQRLTDIDLHSMNLGTVGTYIFSIYLYTGIWNRLTVLYFGYNNCGDIGCKSLINAINLGYYPSLKQLYINNNNITDDGANHFIELFSTNKLPLLSVFAIHENKLSDEWREKFKNALAHRNISICCYLNNDNDNEFIYTSY